MGDNKSSIFIDIKGQKIELSRPTPILSDVDIFPFNRHSDPLIAIEVLSKGEYVLIVDFYSSGLRLLNEIKKYLKNNFKGQTFKGQRNFRSAFHELSNRILLIVDKDRLLVKKSPEVGWLRILYPDIEEFLLSFPQVQGLNSSWQWFQKGISIPVLEEKIYPFYGTYFPTRFDHLILFDNWLNEYQGEKKSAFDIGIGCGVLSFQLIKHGFKKIFGTDTNPNAIIGLHETLNASENYSKIDLLFGDLFANCDEKVELIIFNPPWLPASNKVEGIDKAIYYESDLFPRFFAEAINHLNDNGRIIILFSNLAKKAGVSNNHPIEEELAKGGRFIKDVFLRESVQKASGKTRRNQSWRTRESVELWVLKKQLM